MTYFVSLGELREAEWAEIDQGTALWRYTVTKTNARISSPTPGRLWKPCANRNRSPGAVALCFLVRVATAGR